MRTKIVAGNWKMNTSLAEAKALAESISKNAPENGIQKILFPPFPFLQEVNSIAKPRKDFATGAQNCSEEASGAFTGEVSAAMVSSVGCGYVLVGHSERRLYFKENNEQLRKKTEQAFSNNLKVVFCIGEAIDERKNNSQNDVVKTQIEGVLKSCTPEQLKNIIIAYEPVWAIGTGETATPQQAQDMHAFIRVVLKELFNETVAQTTSVLYGGSCNAQNAKELFACKDIDGGLIGGASLKAEEFCRIINSF